MKNDGLIESDMLFVEVLLVIETELMEKHIIPC